MLGLAAIISGAIGTLDYEGDVEAVYAPVFGAEPAEDGTPAPLANIGAALRFMVEEHGDKDPTYVLMHEPKTEGQHLQILAEHPDRLIFGDYYEFDADGSYRGHVGMSDGAAGQQIAASVYRLHFGSFGGIPIKLAYAVFGAALAMMICAGMNIYFIRRQQRRHGSHRLARAWDGLVWGTPIALALCLPISQISPALPLSYAFWTILALITGLASFVIHQAAFTRSMRIVLASVLGGIVVWRLQNSAPVMDSVFDLTFDIVLIGVMMLLLRDFIGSSRESDPTLLSHPAE
jgi:hypothetical protein